MLVAVKLQILGLRVYDHTLKDNKSMLDTALLLLVY